MMADPVIRTADPAESERLSALARASKATWDYPAEWLEAWREDLRLSPEYIRSNDVFVAEVDGRLAGVIAVADGSDGPEVGHLWVDPGAQGQGVGAALLRRAVEAARSHGWTTLRIEADPFARPFYERFGAEYQGEVPADVCGVSRTLPLLLLQV